MGILRVLALRMARFKIYQPGARKVSATKVNPAQYFFFKKKGSLLQVSGAVY